MFTQPVILRTDLTVNYVTPTGGNLDLFINCGTNDASFWNWKYFWTKTLGTSSPITINGINRNTNGNILESDSTIQGQTVIRAIFAYVANKPITINLTLEADAGGSGQKTELQAKLYYPDGSLIQTFVNSTGTNSNSSITLPATTCPNILWIGALGQPVGPGTLPDSSAKIEMTS
jgi:hypothetical protein